MNSNRPARFLTLLATQSQPSPFFFDTQARSSTAQAARQASAAGTPPSSVSSQRSPGCSATQPHPSPCVDDQRASSRQGHASHEPGESAQGARAIAASVAQRHAPPANAHTSSGQSQNSPSSHQPLQGSSFQ